MPRMGPGNITMGCRSYSPFHSDHSLLCLVCVCVCLLHVVLSVTLSCSVTVNLTHQAITHIRFTVLVQRRSEAGSSSHMQSADTVTLFASTAACTPLSTLTRAPKLELRCQELGELNDTNNEAQVSD
jgi:hypothetical protein